MPRAVALVLLVVAVAACSKAGDENATKQLQAPPPPAELVVPDGVSIALEVDGAAKPPITTATLKATKPDFADSEHRAWLMPTLVPDAAPPGTVIEASSPTGMSLKLAHPMGDGLEPVLYLTRRGELIMAAVDPKQPFPAYHGQGGRLHRAGDQLPHVAPVARLAVTRPATP